MHISYHICVTGSSVFNRSHASLLTLVVPAYFNLPRSSSLINSICLTDNDCAFPPCATVFSNFGKWCLFPDRTYLLILDCCFADQPVCGASSKTYSKLPVFEVPAGMTAKMRDGFEGSVNVDRERAQDHTLSRYAPGCENDLAF